MERQKDKTKERDKARNLGAPRRSTSVGLHFPGAECASRRKVSKNSEKKQNVENRIEAWSFVVCLFVALSARRMHGALRIREGARRAARAAFRAKSRFPRAPWLV